MDKELIRISFIIPTARPVLDGIINYCEKILIKSALEAEIIVINDLQSRHLCISDFPIYFKKFDIKIFNNIENYGPGYSRNIGIRNAQNSYFFFLDDDDDLSLDGLEKLKLISSNSDIICLNFSDSKGTFSNQHVVTSFPNGAVCSSDEYIDILNEFETLSSHCQPYLFKKTFLNAHNLTYPCTYIVEDISFVTSCLIYSKKISVYNFYFYIYSSRSGTLKEDEKFYRLIDIFFAKHWLESCLLSIHSDAKKYLLKKTIALLDLLFISRIIFNEINFLKITNTSYFDDASDKILQSLLIDTNIQHYLDKIYFKNCFQIVGIKSEKAIKSQLNCYFIASRNRIKEKFNPKTIPIEFTLLYCYGPISIGYFLMLKRFNPNAKVFFIDDKINQNQSDSILYGHYTMNIEEFISRFSVNFANSNLQIIICHLHFPVIKKLRSKLINSFSRYSSSAFSLKIDDPYSIFD